MIMINYDYDSIMLQKQLIFGFITSLLLFMLMVDDDTKFEV